MPVGWKTKAKIALEAIEFDEVSQRVADLEGKMRSATGLQAKKYTAEYYSAMSQLAALKQKRKRRAYQRKYRRENG